MSNTTRRGKSIQSFTINQYRKTSDSDARHYKVNPIWGKSKEVKGLPNEAPFKPLKSFFQVYLKGHATYFAFGRVHGMDDLLDKDNNAGDIDS